MNAVTIQLDPDRPADAKDIEVWVRLKEYDLCEYDPTNPTNRRRGLNERDRTCARLFRKAIENLKAEGLL